MSTTLQANSTFGTKLLHILTFGIRDVYKTKNGQLITMKSDQGRVEVDDDGEVNIFDAKNVRAKGVDGVVDEFYLHNCTGSHNRGKKLNDTGDIFEQVEDEDETSDTNTDYTDYTDDTTTTSNNSTGTSSNQKMQDLLNQMLEMIQKILYGETPTVYPTDSSSDTSDITTNISDDTSDTTDTSSDTSNTISNLVSNITDKLSAIFNTTVNDNDGIVNITNNYNPTKTASNATKTTSNATKRASNTTKTNDKITEYETRSTNTIINNEADSIFNTIVNHNDGTINVTNNYYGI